MRKVRRGTQQDRTKEMSAAQFRPSFANEAASGELTVSEFDGWGTFSTWREGWRETVEDAINELYGYLYSSHE